MSLSQLQFQLRKREEERKEEHVLFLKGEGSIYNIQNTLTSEICDHVRVVTIVISRGSRDREMSQSGKSQIVKRKEKKK